MCVPLIIGAAAMAATGFVAANLKANAQAKQLSDQARMEIAKGGRIQAAGYQKAGVVRMKGTQLIGENKAALGMSGVDMQSGSPLKALADSRMMNELDAQAVKSGADQEKWASSAQAVQYWNQALQIQTAASQGGFLSGAAQIAGAGFSGMTAPAAAPAASGGEWV